MTVTGTIGVLSARVRVEEKQLLAALTTAGYAALPISPASEPLPLAPSPAGPSTLSADGRLPRVLIDRCRDRVIAAATLPVWKALGVTVLDAGLAASGNRAVVATALAAAGLPRPATFLAGSESAALKALAAIGYPATLLPLAPGQPPILLLDQDSAEAILEHRAVLGGAPDAIGLLQAGTRVATSHTTVVVVGDTAVAVSGTAADDRAARQMIVLAEHAAAALHAEIAGIEIAQAASGPVVWDVHPVPDFRDLLPLGTAPVAEAVASLVKSRLGQTSDWRHEVAVQMTLAQPVEREIHPPREVTDGVALSA